MEAESYSATFKGGGLPEFSTNLGTFKCVGTTLEGTAVSTANQINLLPGYGACEITFGARNTSPQ
ncbi:MAG TPA: hypothetical protein VHQ43_08205 [Solirubrobacterales bacterium]|jgi:hypothetical protein|nr:hypothetical protein [Solirubrobacterales bacterium]